MINITKEVKDAIIQNVLWCTSLFFDFIEDCSKTSIDISYWYNEENWATLIFHEKIIGYVWKKYALIIVRSDYMDEVKIVIDKYICLRVITVEDLNAEVLTLDYVELKDYLEYGINYNRFSASDLWFHTNSI